MMIDKGIYLQQNSDDIDGVGGVAVQVDKPKIKQPSLFQVVMNNDDYTPMEFVVSVLQHFFNLDREKATQVMLTVHTKGKAVCGVYPKDIAETKALQVNQCSQDNEHPLQCHVEEIGEA